MYEEIDTQHKAGNSSQRPVRAATSRRRAALQNQLLELQGALVDVEGVRHLDDGLRDALPVILLE